MNPHEDGPKRVVEAVLVKVLTHRRDDRGMTLESYASRCVRRGEVHELLTTDHEYTDPRMDRVSFLGFAEVTTAGVLDRGDEVLAGDRVIGTVLGFDACHFPNHYNILIRRDTPVTGPELGLTPEAAISFRQARGS
ncbi:DUF6917 domain-containing protein [Actinoplanes rectilineatus]|uniref:DUF6917 domain-containing protein n=1 Tax=Actinoplanes rectilineatus TaxID=113571 RepID=UPI0005F27A99|nr:hypothetical protein [Actinoplanes rectilineatus]